MTKIASQTEMPEETKPLGKILVGEKRYMAFSGLILGFLALALAIGSPFVATWIDPPSQHTDIVDYVMEIKNRLAKGDSPDQETYQKAPSNYIFPTVIILSILAIGLSIGSLIRGEAASYIYPTLIMALFASSFMYLMVLVSIILVVFIILTLLKQLHDVWIS